MVDGRAMPITVEEYKERVAAKLVEAAPTLDAFRAHWIVPPERRELLNQLPDAGRSAAVVRSVEEMGDYDLYDVLADLGYGLAPRTRVERADAFTYKHERWLSAMPGSASGTLKALAGQFVRAGTDGLENPEVFNTPEVRKAGGLAALKALGSPAKALSETKRRMFAA
jgi:type I restriction enzyme R subunit